MLHLSIHSLFSVFYAKKAGAEFRENIWNEDIKQLTGTVSYLTDNPEEGTLLAVADFF